MTSSHDNSLDDIFGSSPPHERERIPHESSVGVPEPSDLPSLRRQHVTAGYRDGISTSKGQHVQNGFDAGFPVGAQLGMRVGTILGIIEGVLRGYEGGASSGVVKKLPQRGAAGASSSNSQETEEARRAKHEQLLRFNFGEKAIWLFQNGRRRSMWRFGKRIWKPWRRRMKMGTNRTSP